MAGTAVALVSGGIDSPVAVAKMVLAGWKIHPVHCSLEPITSDHAEQKTIRGLIHLASQTGPLREASGKIVEEMIVLTVGPILAQFTHSDSMHRDYFVHMKRLYNGIATKLCDEFGASHILTGENLGQVSSQTLGNLGAVEVASSYRFLRPLLGYDKQAIITTARALGTFEISTGPEVCDALGPDRPSTVADISRLLKQEGELGGLNSLVEACFTSRRSVSIVG